MKKSDLRTGHIVTLRNGKKFIVMLNASTTKHGVRDVLVRLDRAGWQDLADYSENMFPFYEKEKSQWDIVCVEEADYFSELVNVPVFLNELWRE